MHSGTVARPLDDENQEVQGYNHLNEAFVITCQTPESSDLGEGSFCHPSS